MNAVFDDFDISFDAEVNSQVKGEAMWQGVSDS